MPKLKLRDWQFQLMYDAVSQSINNDLQDLYKFLCTCVSKPFSDSISEIEEKYSEVLNEYNHLQEIYKAKVHLFALEHQSPLSSEETVTFSDLNAQLLEVNNVLDMLTSKKKRIADLQNIAGTILRKMGDKDFFSSYDDDPPADDSDDCYDDSDDVEKERLWDALVY